MNIVFAVIFANIKVVNKTFIEYKLCDLSKFFYFCQELVNNMSYNEKSDIWSMGCMLYELCSLHPPFTASNQSELNKKICIGEFNRIPIRYSSDLNEVIAKLLRVEV